MTTQARVRDYQSPRLDEVVTAAREAKANAGVTVTAVVFWGRERYVSILTPYLERMLVVNGGVVDKLLLLTGGNWNHLWNHSDPSDGNEVYMDYLVRYWCSMS